jgi:hypothetical protein
VVEYLIDIYFTALRTSYRRISTGVYLVAGYLTGIYFIAVYFLGAYFIGVHLTGVYI